MSRPPLTRPAGPRGRVGAAAEDAAAAHLMRAGWAVLARNLRLDRDEVDILACEGGPEGVLVVVEVRSASGRSFGSPLESVDRRKVWRLYRATMMLRREGHPALSPSLLRGRAWRVDLLTMRRGQDGWTVEHHLRGLAPP